MTQQYGLNILGAVRVFRKDKEITGHDKEPFIFENFYETVTDVWFNVSEKEDDGSYFNKSMNLLFKKGLDYPENNTVIQLTGFPVITGTGDYRRIAFMVTDWKEA